LNQLSAKSVGGWRVVSTDFCELDYGGVPQGLVVGGGVEARN